MMMITAHRGFSSRAPENTLSAFDQAMTFGCPWIEFDTRLSSDDIPVVIHDETVNRCTDGNGRVRTLRLEELKTLDAGLWFGETFRGERIPTLEEVLALCEPHHVQLNIELKGESDTDLTLLCDKIVALLEKRRFPATQLLFSSFSYLALKTMQDLRPDIRRGQLWCRVPADALNILQSLDAFSAHCDYRFLDQNQVNRLKSGGYQIFCYTPNCPKSVEKHQAWGIDMVITDYPDAYLPV
jgi:glycerophosphoryl diester phosphodiesterase